MGTVKHLYNKILKNRPELVSELDGQSIGEVFA